MNYAVKHKRNERNDRRKSAIITLLVSLLLLLGLYFYTFTKYIPKTEVVTTMLINFGDKQEGSGTEEPVPQEGSAATVVEPQPQLQPEPKPEPLPKPEPKPQPAESKKVITGKNTKVSTPKVEKTKKTETKEKSEKTEKTTSKTTTKKEEKKETSSKTSNKTATASTKTTETSKKQGDAQGNAAIGNLIKARGTAQGSQGTSSNNTGNSGDPLGGNSNGESKIGTDRKLIAYIPGTMGRGGAKPESQCSASGQIVIAYTVDRAGNVTSARRSSGISDNCVVSTAIAWVKQYVKAEKSNTTSTGTYRITF